MVSINVKRFSRSKVIDPAPQAPASVVPETENTLHITIPDDDDNYDLKTEIDPIDFSDLTRSGFESNLRAANAEVAAAAAEAARRKEEAAQEKEMRKKIESMEKKAAAAAAKRGKPANKAASPPEDDGSIFAEEGTAILGREKRKLITKITQYKQLFPAELKTFKVKKNASETEMRAYLEEMECIVQTGSLDTFITESIVGCLKMIEGVTSYTQNFNISGLSDMLKMNPRFHSLCKQLYIKYETFDQVPPEQQLVLLVATTSYICMAKNRNKSKIEEILNEPIGEPKGLAPSAPEKTSV